MRLLTHGLPGTGGLIKVQPDDFIVDEIPAYSPSGEGPHTFLRIEKRGLTTEEALTRLCIALDIRRDEAGLAGQKDRQAVTRQWVSMPNLDPARALALNIENVKVLEAARHQNKLRTGHLTGNRFTIVVRGTTDGLARARAILEKIAQTGVPNYFGDQRFGRRHDNAGRGRAIVLGENVGRIGRVERRLLVSAYQASMFNRYLDSRIDDGLVATVLLGDVMKKHATGGLFIVGSDELHVTQARVDRGEIGVTGPLYGHKMMAPPEATPAALREQAVLDDEGIEPADFDHLGRIAEGTRRSMTVPVENPEVTAGDEEGSIVLRFTLPPGSYATVLLGEIIKEGPAAEAVS